MNQRRTALSILGLAFAAALWTGPLLALSSPSTKTYFQGEVVCPAGGNVVLAPYRPSRGHYALVDLSTFPARVSYGVLASTNVILSSTNSFAVYPGTTSYLADSGQDVDLEQINCGGGATVAFLEQGQ